MLSAQKQKMPQDTATENSRTPTSGFGKVLNSIQGLQQRLDDFSVEEVTRAHAKTNELLLRLGEMQSRLQVLAQFKKAFTDTSAAIAALPEIDIPMIDAASLKDDPRVRAVIEAGKLIRAHREKLTAEAKSRSLDTVALPEISSDAPRLGSDSQIDTDTPVPGSDAVRQPVQEFTLVDQPYEPPSAKSLYDFADLKLETPSEGETRPHPTVAETKERGVQANGTTRSNPQFNERLLNELIDAYGEFVVSTKAEQVAEPAAKREPAAGKPEPVRQASVAQETIRVLEPPCSALVVRDAAGAKARTADSAPDQPAFVEPIATGQLSLPAPQEEIGRPAFEQSLPNAKARGEIDRQLKSIIKDYGQVDLYSHGKRINMKTTAIGAAALLALVLGGLVFFKAPSGSPRAPVESAASTDAAPADGAVKNQAKKK